MQRQTDPPLGNSLALVPIELANPHEKRACNVLYRAPDLGGRHAVLDHHRDIARDRRVAWQGRHAHHAPGGDLFERFQVDFGDVYRIAAREPMRVSKGGGELTHDADSCFIRQNIGPLSWRQPCLAGGLRANLDANGFADTFDNRLDVEEIDETA